MKATRLYTCFFIAVLSLGFSNVRAQEYPLDTLSAKYSAWRNSTVLEKIFVHTDRSSYLTGEAVWLKVYRVEATTHKRIDWSRIVYLEILDQNNVPVLQSKLALTEHGGKGAMFLPATLASGNYILRAYTHTMKNAGPESFFHQPIQIINPFVPLVNTAETKEVYDAQFLPEGGVLISDMESIVGVRVVNKAGHGISYTGAVLNQQNDTVARFSSAKFGLGKVKFMPKGGNSYKTVIVDEQGKSFSYPMPLVKPEGYTMTVRDSAEFVTIIVKHKGLNVRKVYLLAHTRQILKIAQQGLFNTNTVKFVIPKNELNEGVSNFTIFNEQLEPVCERVFFIQPKEQLDIKLTANHYLYKIREKIKLDILFTAPGNKPVDPVMSVAVYQRDSLDLPVQHIGSYLWLTSDLSGTVEQPEYYFGKSPGITEDIDNLMLTHGWRKFDWKTVLKPKTEVIFQPEIGGHLVMGRVVNAVTGVPAHRIPVYLSFMGKPIHVYVSQSLQGRVLFETKPITGNKSMIIQTPETLDDKYRIEIDDPYADKFARVTVLPFSLNQRQAKALEQRSIHMQVQTIFNGDPVIPPFTEEAFYFKPDETYQLDDYTRFPTLEEVMREYVPGIRVKKRKDEFHLANIDLVNRTAFSGDPLVLVDGVPIFNINKLMEIDPLKMKQLDVIKRRYFLSAMAFDGVVSYTSYKGDLGGYQVPERALLINYKGLETERQFFAPKYDLPVQGQETLPDTRRVLFWSADTSATGNHATAEFFTSDITGEYRIVIQALTAEGIPGYYTSTFWVK